MCCRHMGKAYEVRSLIVERANVKDLIVEVDLVDMDDVESFPIRQHRESVN